MESNGLPISIRTSPANQHDSTKFIDVLENISDFLNDDLIHAIVSAYADKGYDDFIAYIRNYLRCYGINCCIPMQNDPHDTHWHPLLQSNPQILFLLES